jgi:hypothetical protein
MKKMNKGQPGRTDPGAVNYVALERPDVLC